MPATKPSSKQKQEKHYKKLTDFFPPKPKTQSTPQTPSQLEDTRNIAVNSKRTDETRVSGTATLSRHAIAAVEPTPRKQPAKRVLSIPTTTKRHITPQASSKRSSHPAIRVTSAIKRKTPTDSDVSEDEANGTRRTLATPPTAHFKLTDRALSSKKPRLTPDPEEVAATSQSEELELDSAPYCVSGGIFSGPLTPLDTDVEESAALPQLHIIRSSSLSPVPSSQWSEAQMEDIDMEPPISSPVEPSSPRLLTPPLTDNRVNSAPHSPQETATERFLRETKERAYKKALEDEKKSLPDFEEDLDSDTDEELVVVKPRAGPKKDAVEGSSTRYNLRAHDTALSRPTKRECRKESQTITAERRTRTSNPLNAMLREKKNDEQRGVDSEAFRRAEELLLSERSKSSSEESNDMDDPFNDNPLPSKIEDLDTTIIIDDDERERLLGTENSKVVGQLLGKDKTQEAALPENSRGVPFWQSATENGQFMDIDAAADYQWPEYSLLSPRLALLKKVLDGNDLKLATVLLTSGIITYWPKPDLDIAVQQLTYFVLSPSPLSERGSLQEMAYWALLQIWAEGQSHSVTLPLPVVAIVLLQLGARNDCFRLLSRPLLGSFPVNAINADLRTKILRRVVALISQCASSRHIAHGDVPDILILLLQVGMDSSTPTDTKLELTRAINTLCNSLNPNLDIIPLEIQLCNLVLRLLESYDILNGRVCLSFLSCGCDRTARMARYISFCVLLDVKQLNTDVSYHEPLPVERLLPVLTPRFHEKARGKFDLNSRTVYEHMTALTHILSIALSDVDSLVIEEIEKRKAQTLQLSDVLGQEYKTPLTQIRDALEILHGKITDTRAAMLDRTQTKAALKTLSIRLWLQATSSESLHQRKPLNSDRDRDASGRMKPQLKMKQGNLQQFFKS